MAAPLTVKRNNYLENPKKSDIFTPVGVAKFLHSILYQPIRRGVTSHRPLRILDPSIGEGALTYPWVTSGESICGVDIKLPRHLPADYKIKAQYESIIVEELPWKPDLVIMNPPFNGGTGRALYPEVFLKHTFDLFGSDVAVCMFTPHGCRLNQRKASSRWRWLRDCGAKLTSIVSLPLDIFPGVLFHAEILIFNVQGIEPHYFLPDEAIH